MVSRPAFFGESPRPAVFTSAANCPSRRFATWPHPQSRILPVSQFFQFRIRPAWRTHRELAGVRPNHDGTVNTFPRESCVSNGHPPLVPAVGEPFPPPKKILKNAGDVGRCPTGVRVVKQAPSAASEGIRAANPSRWRRFQSGHTTSTRTERHRPWWHPFFETVVGRLATGGIDLTPTPRTATAESGTIRQGERANSDSVENRRRYWVQAIPRENFVGSASDRGDAAGAWDRLAGSARLAACRGIRDASAPVSAWYAEQWSRTSHWLEALAHLGAISRSLARGHGRPRKFHQSLATSVFRVPLGGGSVVPLPVVEVDLAVLAAELFDAALARACRRLETAITFRLALDRDGRWSREMNIALTGCLLQNVGREFVPRTSRRAASITAARGPPRSRAFPAWPFDTPDGGVPPSASGTPLSRRGSQRPGGRPAWRGVRRRWCG